MKRIIFITSLLFGTAQFLISQINSEIIPNLNKPTDMIVVGDDMYYIERFTINRVDVSKVPFNPQVVATGIGRGAGLAIKDNFLYATDFDAGLILKIDISTTDFNSEVLISGLRTPDMLAIDGDILYYTDPNAELIGSISLTDSNPQMVPLIRNAGRAIGIAIYENELFYTDQIEGTVSKVILGVPFPRAEVVFSGLVRPQGLSKCGSEIYVSDDLGLSIWKFNPSCSPDELESVLSGIDTPRQTAISNNFLYTIAIDGENITRQLFENSACYVDNHVICASDTLTWLDGNTYTSTNNTASVTLQNVDGCDSIVMLNLTINETNLDITSSEGVLTAVETEGTYLWLNCRDGFGPLFDETMSSFTPGHPGLFAVEITKNGCVDTTACIRASIPTSVLTINQDSPFDLYPNPTAEMLTIDFEELSTGNIEVFTLAGQLVNTYEMINERSFNFPISQPAGVYLVRVQLGDLSWTERILKL